MNKPSQKPVVDKLVDAYVSWREACLRVSDAYGSWASETGPNATSSFRWYMAALDQEERAADVYAGFIRRAGERSSRKDNPAGPPGGAIREVGLRWPGSETEPGPPWVGSRADLIARHRWWPG